MTIKEKKRLIFLLALIVLLGFFLRFYRLEQVPPGLYIDEVDVGYQAYSILKTGRDYFGNFLPIHFHSLADWRTPFYLYASVPTIALFGLNEWGVRLPALIFGIATIPLIFFLMKQLFPRYSNFVFLLSALLLAISPWHLQYSRIAFEATMMLFFFLAGLLAFFQGLKKGQWLILSVFLFLLTPYVYSTAKFFLPLFILLLVFIYRKQIFKQEKQHLFAAVGLGFLMALPMVREIIFGQGGSRFAILSIFTDPNSIAIVLHRRFLTTFAKPDRLLLGLMPASVAVVFFNKFVNWALVFFQNYLDAFSPQFLFLSGDPNPRHSLPDMGMVYWLEVFFLPLGIYGLTKVKDKKTKWFLFLWLLLAPIPAAITRDGAGHGTRLFFQLPVLIILSSLGLFQIVNWLKKIRLRRLVLAVLALVFFFNFSWYLFDYHFVYSFQSFPWWDYGNKELINKVEEHEENFQKVVFTLPQKEILQFILFFKKIDPDYYQKKGLPEKYQLAEFDPKLVIDKNFMIDKSCQELYVGKEEEVKKLVENKKLPQYLSLVDLVKYPTGGTVFYLVRKVGCQ